MTPTVMSKEMTNGLNSTSGMPRLMGPTEDAGADRGDDGAGPGVTGTLWVRARGEQVAPRCLLHDLAWWLLSGGRAVLAEGSAAAR